MEGARKAFPPFVLLYTTADDGDKLLPQTCLPNGRRGHIGTRFIGIGGEPDRARPTSLFFGNRGKKAGLYCPGGEINQQEYIVNGREIFKPCTTRPHGFRDDNRPPQYP